MDDRSQLEDVLRTLEGRVAAYDAGDPTVATQIAEGLRRIFQPSPTAPSLLSRLNATYLRVASSVPKAPYPDDRFLPLIQAEIDLTSSQGQVLQASTDVASVMGRPRFKPAFGSSRHFRQVQAPDWWKNEPVFILDHSRITRKDLTLWAVSRGRELPPGEKPPQAYERLRQGRAVYLRLLLPNGVPVEAPIEDAQPAALRQVAHEVINSAELRKLAQGGKP